jgi:SAM-dependent methyltransferase
MDMAGLYSGSYVDSTYGPGGIPDAFDRVAALPPESSDNAGRVQALVAFAERRFGDIRTPTVLDVGAGTGVFPHAIKQAGWRCTAFDPDPRAVAHCRDRIGVDAVCGDFLTIDLDELDRFDVVTFNRVLEHVDDPVAMLARSCHLVAEGGFVYVELPDGEAARREGPGREEFFIEHHHIFSPASVSLLASRAGFDVLALQVLQEPSTKYTIRAFLGRP